MTHAGRILVTGGGGFVGAQLVADLVGDGREVVVYDSWFNSSPDRLDPVGPNLRMVTGDIRDTERLRAVLGDMRPDAVVHLAAIHFIPYCNAHPKECWDVNTTGTLSVFEAVAAADVPRVVLASTAAVYPPTTAPNRETDLAGPTDIYGAAKLAGEALAHRLSCESESSVAAARLFNVFGPGETNPHVIPEILSQLVEGPTVHLGNTASRRDYVHVRDVSKALRLLADGASSEFEIFNVGTGRAHSVDDILACLSAQLGYRIDVERSPQRTRRHDRPVLLADPTRLTDAYGWTPTIGLSDGLFELEQAFARPRPGLTVRVALVGPHPAPGEPPSGGIEAVTCALARGLSQLGVDVSIITGSETSTRSTSDVIDGLSYLSFPVRSSTARPTLFALERRHITKTLLRLRPDVVHVQGANFYGPAALAAGLPTVVTLHGLLHREAQITDKASGRLERASKRLRGWGNSRFETQTLDRARHIVVISPYVDASVRNRTEATFHDIPNPISPEFFDVERHPEPGRLLFVGAIEPRKNPALLVKAFSRAGAAHPGSRLILVGKPVDHEYHRSVLREIEASPISDQVTYAGMVSQDELLDEYSRAAALILPSREESSPMAIQQAMAAGLPVVASRAGGIGSLVADGRTGLLVDPGDEAALAGALRHVIEHPAEAAGLGGAARADADRFRPETVAEATRAAYEQVLALSTTS